MGFAFSTSTREVLEQVVREPRFRALTTIPLIAPVSIGLIMAAYAVFFATTYFYLQGDIHWAVMLLINGISVYAAFTPLHDATHRTVSSSRKLNDLLGTIACFALLPGITTRIYRYLHLEHHRYSGDRIKDPDEPFVSAPWWSLHFILAAPDILWTIWYLRHWSSRPISERVEFSLGIAFYVAWHAVWLLSPYALEFFMIWMIPQRIGMWIVTYFFAHIQHPEDVLWEEAPFQATVYIRANWFQRWIMLSQTEHCIHHLIPNLPFYRYHKAWEAGKTLFEPQNIPVRDFFTPAQNIVLPTDSQHQWIDVEIAKVEEIAEGIKSFELRPENGQTLPRFTAGAHIDVMVQEGLIRQYSLHNAPSTEGFYQIAVKKEIDGRGGSKAIHEYFSEGKSIKISKPRNNFQLRDLSQHTILVAGGIGITPIMAMAKELHEQPRSFELHICARNQAALPFGKDLDALPFAKNIHIHLDDGDDAQKFDPAKIMGAGDISKKLFVCGPTAFMSWIMDTARDNGWADENMISETFVARTIETRENKPFEVVLKKSGKTFQVGADEFLIDVLNHNNCGIPCSCTQGICGSCITPVAEGEVDHRDAILTDQERIDNDKMCVCVGRAKGDRLVLDI